MKKLTLITITLLVTIISCNIEDPKINPIEEIDGIWLVDQSIGDNINSYKYIVFEDSIIHFYVENQMGGHKYFSGQFEVINDSLIISGVSGWIDSYNTWSIDGNSILISGSHDSFGGEKVSEMPNRDEWVTNIQFSNPEYHIQDPYSCGGGPYLGNLSKSNNPNEFISTWSCLCRTFCTRVFMLSSITGEVIDEVFIKDIPSDDNYGSIASAGQDKMVIGLDNSIELVDCNGYHYSSTITTAVSPSGLASDGDYIWVFELLRNDEGLSNGEGKIIKMDFDGNIISESSLFKIFYYNSTMTYGDEHLWLVDGYDIYKIDPVELTTLVSYRMFNGDINACQIGAIEYINGEVYISSCTQMYKFKPN